MGKDQGKPKGRSTGCKVKDPVTGLTPKMEAFALALAISGDQSASYRKAYNCENMKAETISRNAFTLANDSKVTARLQQLRTDVRRDSGITLLEHLEKLEELRDAAQGEKEFSSAITAEMARGKVSGLYVDKKEVSGDVTIHVITGVPHAGA